AQSLSRLPPKLDRCNLPCPERWALPPGYFAMIMRKTAPSEPYSQTSGAAGYARTANRVAICRSADDIVAVVEIVSPGNKECRHAIRTLARTVLKFLAANVSVL